MIKRCLSLALGLAVLLAPTLRVNADSTEDLLNVYGLTLGGPIKSEIEKQMGMLEKELLSMQSQGAQTEEYNAVLKEYISKRESFIDDILNDISIYRTRNEAVASSIADNILDADIKTLTTLDAQYKSNESYINELLSTMNEYKIDYAYRDIAVDISGVESKLSEAKSLYIESIDVFDLGKVKNIDFVLDTDRHVNSAYGYRIDPLDKSTIRFHSGTDYRAVTGSPIHALFNGEVISCGWSNAIGYYVTVQSGENVKYLVCHCSELNISEGDIISQGDVIAFVGGTGTQCTGPHLHMALYLNGVTYDVDQLFK